MYWMLPQLLFCLLFVIGRFSLQGMQLLFCLRVLLWRATAAACVLTARSGCYRIAHTIPSPPRLLPPRASLCSTALYSFLIQHHYFHPFTHLSCLFPTFLLCQSLHRSSHMSLSRAHLCVELTVRLSVRCGRRMLLRREGWVRVEGEWEALKREKPF